MGWHRAGYDVVGVDINPQPNYPFEFHQADALDFLRIWGTEFHIRHASPPCQASTALTKGTNAGREYPQLIPQTRAALAKFTGPSVIENVQGSAVRKDAVLCGEMFGLGVIRHRYFELSHPIAVPPHPKHRGRVTGWRHGQRYDGPYFAVYGDGGGKGSLAQWQQAMGIEWMTDKKELAEAIPPAYTQFIGEQLLSVLTDTVTTLSTSVEKKLDPRCAKGEHTLTTETWPASCIRCGWVNRLMTREEFRRYFGITT